MTSVGTTVHGVHIRYLSLRRRIFCDHINGACTKVHSLMKVIHVDQEVKIPGVALVHSLGDGIITLLFVSHLHRITFIIRQ